MTYNSFFNNVACGFLICKNDPYSTIIEANEAFYNMVGYSREEMEVLFKNRFASLVRDDLTEILEKVSKATKGKKILDYEYRIQHKSGKIIWIHDIATYDEEKDLFNVVIMDISYKEKLLEVASREARIDKMTGLLNRLGLEERINFLIANNHKSESQTMIIIDLDNFKELNDTKGHLEGDKLLSLIGERFIKKFRKTDTIGRLGGDEFIIFLNDLYGKKEVERIGKMLSNMLKIDFEGIKISASIGICVDRSSSLSYEELFSVTDKLAYDVKANGKEGYKIKFI